MKRSHCGCPDKNTEHIYVCLECGSTKLYTQPSWQHDTMYELCSCGGIMEVSQEK